MQSAWNEDIEAVAWSEYDPQLSRKQQLPCVYSRRRAPASKDTSLTKPPQDGAPSTPTPPSEDGSSLSEGMDELLLVPVTPTTDDVFGWRVVPDITDGQTAEQPHVPPRCCECPQQEEKVRGATYLNDRIKVDAGAPLLELCAAHVVELPTAEHVVGATAALIDGGGFVPPPWARFMLSIYFMNPTPHRASGGAGAPTEAAHALLLHFASATRPSDASGPSAALLRELWSGDVVKCLSRLKIIVRLNEGPSMLTAALALMRVDATRPFLLAKQIDTSLHRSRLSSTGGSSAGGDAGAGGGASDTLEHVELGCDVAGNWIGARVYRAAFGAVKTIDVSLTFVLEARTPQELPERAIASVNVKHLDPVEVAFPPHPAWPQGVGAATVPGESARVTAKEVIAALKQARR